MDTGCGVDGVAVVVVKPRLSKMVERTLHGVVDGAVAVVDDDVSEARNASNRDELLSDPVGVLVVLRALLVFMVI